ncbi:predicted protein [Plenodomus lingam JN3]|uniref:Predicted protein n=1 Tax=Leptosphaeria maculans (strain JN3 / isolate v23.1.3 / race Av1-4-5-6-7-8) TaxID=985895 RepID=E4ZYG0_LEPMJ|nr:predicted protein [Plenodomus lingam JN3]CBX96486.1 predicted protein [Plenodomus lingam JN3]
MSSLESPAAPYNPQHPRSLRLSLTFPPPPRHSLPHFLLTSPTLHAPPFCTPLPIYRPRIQTTVTQAAPSVTTFCLSPQ